MKSKKHHQKKFCKEDDEKIWFWSNNHQITISAFDADTLYLVATANMQPSYKHSTLSLAFIVSLASIPVLILIALWVAIFAPEAYALSSQDKMLVLVLVVAYLGFVSNIVGAYLGTRNSNKIPDDQVWLLAQTAQVQEQTKPEEEQLTEMDYLALNKLEAHDTTNQ